MQLLCQLVKGLGREKIILSLLWLLDIHVQNLLEIYACLKFFDIIPKRTLRNVSFTVWPLLFEKVSTASPLLSKTAGYISD